MALMGARARRLLLGAILGVGLLVVFFRGLDGPALMKAFRAADPVYLAGVVLMTVLTYLVRAWRWGYLLAPLARVPLLRLFSITNVGFASGLVIPRAGEVVRPYLVARHHGLKTSAAFRDLQSQLEGTENRIAVARRDYIDAVREYDTAIQVVPGRFVAGFGDFTPAAQLTMPEAERTAPKVDFGAAK